MKIGLIGCGYWGKNYLRLLKRDPRVQVGFVIEPNLARQQEIKAMGVPAYSQLEAAIKRTEIEAAVVCSPSYQHERDLITLAVERVHTLCEKPLVLPGQDPNTAFQRFMARDTVLYPGLTYQHNDSVKQLRQIIAGESTEPNNLGELQYINCIRTNQGPIRNDASCVFDLMVHDMTIAFEATVKARKHFPYAGAKASFAHKWNNQNQLGTVIAHTLVHGYPATFYSSWNEPGKKRCAKFVFENGIIRFDEMKTLPIEIEYSNGARMTFSAAPGPEPLQAQFDDFYETITSEYNESAEHDRCANYNALHDAMTAIQLSGERLLVPAGSQQEPA